MRKDDLDCFLLETSSFGELWGPTKQDGKFAYEKIEDRSRLYLGNEIPMIPPKKLFHPPTFDVAHFSEEDFTSSYDWINNRVLFGIHPCDIHGLMILDKFFGEPPADPYWVKSREKTIVIGFSCIPCESCLCKSTGTDLVHEGFDLFFTDLEDYYLVWVGSSVGDDMTRVRQDVFDEKVEKEDIKKYFEWRTKRDSCFVTDFEFKNLPDMMELSYASKIWEGFGDKCLSCGQCTIVCPTCNCYDAYDEINMSADFGGSRRRRWDSCMFADYSLVAGGHNFRGKRSERLKLWYTHKLRAFSAEYAKPGKPSCVGCGRCVVTCPVEINVLTVTDALSTGEVRKSK
nr:4Fe-4S dicluster domain-containing protein [Candidatus Njordarchaeota archaeon]